MRYPIQFLATALLVLVTAMLAGCQGNDNAPAVQNAREKGLSPAQKGAADAANQNYVGGSASSAALDADRLTPPNRGTTQPSPPAVQNPAK